MSEESIVEDILDGVFCHECGQYIGDAVGYSRKCSDCNPPKTKKYKSKSSQISAIKDDRHNSL
jgi:hypothetical protein